jgi:AraC-like DNA-binding protein
MNFIFFSQLEWIIDVCIARLADSLGYSDQGSFTKAFRAQTGNTPSAWRQQAQQKMTTNIE